MKATLRLHVAALLMTLSATAAAAAAVAVDVDFNANRHPFSPLIFGVSFGAAARNAQVGYPLVRWGGNSTTRYNWQADVHNTASDYFFENIVDCKAQSCTGTPPAGNSADTFVGAALAAGAQPLVTIPTIGWAPRADSPASHPFLFGFSTDKYGPQQATDSNESKAGNGYCGAANHTAYCVNGSIVGNDPTDTSVAVDPAFEQGWIGHLRSAFGTAANGGVRFFSLDNEPMLWNSTHRDVHPDPVGYDEAWERTLAYAAAIKQTEPDAQVTGPVTWGYCDLFGSAQDSCHVGSDRQAHGLPFVAWYLQQVCANLLAGGAHAVDYLDLHYYPQGSDVALYEDDSAPTAALRLRSLKELYDPAWTSESWIADLGDDATWHYSKPGLIPRVRAWIDQYCPGTRLAITEYNWGGDTTVSGALAQAELFGIFARDGVDLAARWVAPAADSKVEQAFTLFLDYDGAGGRVAGDSAAATSADIDLIGAYAFRDFARHNFVLLTNKDTSSRSVALAFAQGQAAACALFGFDATQGVHPITLSCAGGTSLSLSLPARSANLLVFPDQDGLFRDGFD
jgi:Glycoside hydrolase family 44